MRPRLHTILCFKICTCDASGYFEKTLGHYPAMTAMTNPLCWTSPATFVKTKTLILSQNMTTFPYSDQVIFVPKLTTMEVL